MSKTSALERHIQIMMNEERKHLSSLPTSLYQQANCILNKEPWCQCNAAGIITRLQEAGIDQLHLQGKNEKYDSIRIAKAIIAMDEAWRSTTVVRGISLFQKEVGADGGEAAGVPIRNNRDEDAETRAIRRALWGNKPDEEIRAKMTGGRTNQQQVAGKHYLNDTVWCPNCGEHLQHWDIYHNRPYLEGQITKYLWRWQSKNGVEDLKKARHFLDKLIETAVMEEPHQ